MKILSKINLFRVLVALWILSLAANGFILNRISAAEKFKTEAARQAAEPAKLEVTIIKDSSCEDCYDLKIAFDYLKKINTAIVSEKVLERDSEEAKNFIEKYEIKRLPTFVASGELYKNEQLKQFISNAGEVKDNIFVFKQVSPPYVEPQSGEVKGRFQMIYLTDTSCKDCYDVLRHGNALSNLGMTVSDDKVVDVSLAEGRSLVKKYRIEHVPTVILTGDLKEYSNFQLVWPTVGTVEKDGAYVFRENGEKIMGTYKSLKTGQIIAPKNQAAETPGNN